MMEISELPNRSEINDIMEKHDLLIAVNGMLCCCFDLSLSKDKWASVFSMLNYPTIFTFFKLTSDGKDFFIPMNVVFSLFVID